MKGRVCWKKISISQSAYRLNLVCARNLLITFILKSILIRLNFMSPLKSYSYIISFDTETNKLKKNVKHP